MHSFAVLLISDLVVSDTTGTHAYCFGSVPHVSTAHSEIANLTTLIARFSYLLISKGFSIGEYVSPHWDERKGSILILVSNSGERSIPKDRRQMGPKSESIAGFLQCDCNKTNFFGLKK